MRLKEQNIMTLKDKQNKFLEKRSNTKLVYLENCTN